MKNQNTQEAELLPADNQPTYQQPIKALAAREEQPLAAAEPRPASALTSLDILESAVRGGITSENVAVVKEIIAMRREEIAHDSKAKFNGAFFALRQELGQMNFYADKAAKDENGKVLYRFCSEKELSAGLEPVLLKHGFTMLFGQRDEETKAAAIITLIHKDGHEETREYSVRSGNTNRVKDATAADTGATTSAWRHLVIKMFGLKSRISESDDARNIGGAVTEEEADELERRVKMVNADVPKFLKFAGNAKSFREIPAIMYPLLDTFLKGKEKGQ